MVVGRFQLACCPGRRECDCAVGSRNGVQPYQVLLPRHKAAAWGWVFVDSGLKWVPRVGLG
jgi:hypothetical protein